MSRYLVDVLTCVLLEVEWVLVVVTVVSFVVVVVAAAAVDSSSSSSSGSEEGMTVVEHCVKGGVQCRASLLLHVLVASRHLDEEWGYQQSFHNLHRWKHVTIPV